MTHSAVAGLYSTLGAHMTAGSGKSRAISNTLSGAGVHVDRSVLVYSVTL